METSSIPGMLLLYAVLFTVVLTVRYTARPGDGVHCIVLYSLVAQELEGVRVEPVFCKKRGEKKQEQEQREQARAKKKTKTKNENKKQR